MSRLRLATLPDGSLRLMSAEDIRRLRASSKGGRTAAQRGTRYRWTSKTARAAALKAWATRWRRLRYSGVRAGRPRHQRPPVNHVKLRAYYMKHATLGIRFNGSEWLQSMPPLRTPVPISERTALIRLGHLPPARPRHQIPIDDGIELASTRPTPR